MRRSNSGRRRPLATLGLGALFLAGCAPSIGVVRDNFASYGDLVARLQELRDAHGELIREEAIGMTHEGRSIFAVRVAGPSLDVTNAPALLAIFGAHGAEHDVIELGIGLIESLAAGYGTDSGITGLLDRNAVWMVPMLNPDGVEYDLSGSVKPFSWRKNRRPTGGSTWGVDLNRNWEPRWHAEIPSDLAAELRDPRSPEFAGERPFSEPETRAVRDFLLRHPEIAIFLDYHSGFAPFLQGGVGFPIPPSEMSFPPGHRIRLEELSAGLAAAVSDPGDERPGFVVNKERDVAKTLGSIAPWWARVFLPESIPSPPGTSGEWVYGELEVAVLGLEIMRDWGYFRRLPSTKQRLLESQVGGLIYLLGELSSDPFDDDSPR